MNVIFRWVGFLIKPNGSLLIPCMVHRSLLFGFERRDSVSTAFLHHRHFLTYQSYIIANLPEGGVGVYGWDDGQGDD
jgi:hypothetical protein